MEEDFEREIKVIVVGNGGVGKTSMIRRFCKGVYTDQYKKTIGVDFLEKLQYVDNLGEDVRMMLWDTAGQEEFDTITRSYYRGAGAAVIAFSTIDRDSFDAVRMWYKKVKEECGDIPIALVQNKVDLIDQSVVTSSEAEECAAELKTKFYRACVKENLNVAQVFHYLAEVALTRESEAALEQASHLNSAMEQSTSATAAAAEPGLERAPSAPRDFSTPPKIMSAAEVQAAAEPKINFAAPTKMRTGGKKKKFKCLG